jgi:hypothetical protein
MNMVLRLRFAVVDLVEDVRVLEVPVDDPLLMCVLQGTADGKK